jgi:hypothetical protein
VSGLVLVRTIATSERTTGRTWRAKYAGEAMHQPWPHFIDDEEV